MFEEAARAVLHAARITPGRGMPTVVGVAGPPGSGKTTLARAIVEHADDAVAVPMDGFHLANVELARLGRAHRKGAPDTFDSAGYVDLLKRLHSQAADSC